MQQGRGGAPLKKASAFFKGTRGGGVKNRVATMRKNQSMKGTRIIRDTLALLLAIAALVVNVSYAKKAGKPRKLPKPVFFINENKVSLKSIF